MPQVIALPLGGLSTELGSIQDRITDLENRRLGAIAQAVAIVSSVPDSGLWTYPTGWPSLDVSVSTTGGALAVFNCTVPLAATTFVELGLSVDGGTPIIGSVAPTASTQFSVVWLADLALGEHTIQLQALNSYSSAVNFTNPSVAVIPV